MAKPDDPVRAALEEAKHRPLPPEDERQRLLALAEEAMKAPRRSTEEFLAKLAALRPAAE
jgi:hypothetical protein